MVCKKTLLLKYRAIMEPKGITLIELIIALSLFGIVLAIAFSFYSFNTGIFDTAQKRSNAQHDILMAANFITKELRTATYVRLSMDEIIEDDDGLYNSHLGLKDGHLEHQYKDKNNNIIRTDIVEINFTLDQNTNLLKFYITGNECGQLYRIDSEVSILNLEKLPDETTSGSWIHYYKPFLD